MDDELNIAHRETDYLDDYNGPPANNFYELKSRLADLGFTDSTLKILRTELMRGKPDLTLYWPMRRQTKQTYFLNINQNQMNNENLSYLQKQLLNLGFG